MVPRPAALLAARTAVPWALAMMLAIASATPACAPDSARPGFHTETGPELKASHPSQSMEARVRALEQAIEDDRRQLRDLIATPRDKDHSLRNDPQLREIAERLPRLEEELRQLMEEWPTKASAEAKAR